MRILFVVPIQNRGAMTEAVAIKQILERNNHTVCKVVVTRSRDSNADLPEFFAEHFASITDAISESLCKTQTHSGRLSLWKSFIGFTANLIRLSVSGARKLQHYVDEVGPDLIINFAEPLVGLWHRRYNSRHLVISVGMWFGCRHPEFSVPSRYNLHRHFYSFMAGIAGYGSFAKIGILFQRLNPWHQWTLHILPPLIRDEIRGLKPRCDNELVVHLGNRLSLESFLNWYRRNDPREFQVTVISDEVDESITGNTSVNIISRFDSNALNRIERADGVISYGGFDFMAEAMSLEKPVGIIPDPDDFVQYTAAWSAMREGAGLMLRSTDQIPQFIPYMRGHKPNPALSAWIGSGEERFVRMINQIEHEGNRARQWTARASKPLSTVKLPVINYDDG